ncbi:MAG: LysR family transcriptional regulator [Geminicoccaceae bacterium]
MDRLSDTDMFLAIVEGGSFSAAARQLGRTPSSISKQMARMEDRLGARLVQRTTRKLNLTSEGRIFYERCRVIMTELREAEAAVAAAEERPRGVLRVTAPVPFGRYQMQSIIPDFLDRYPEVELDLTLSDAIADLISEGLDLGIRIGGLADESLVVRKLAENRRILCASPAYLAARGTPSSPDDLKHHNCLNYTNNLQLNDWPFETGQGVIASRFDGNFRANSGELLFELALAGLGIIRASEFMAGPAIQRGDLVQLLPEFGLGDSPDIVAVYPHRRHLSAKVRAFVDFMVERFHPVPPWRCSLS